MQNTTKDRFDYHPDPEKILSGAHRGSSLRRVDARKEAILELVDMNGKTLLDLGCSGGYFGFSLAKVVSNYYGLDGDHDLIVRNEEIARSAGLNNLHFEYGQISPQRIQQLPHFDVGIFLSVFHHILAVSKAYEWNQQNSWSPIEILAALANKVDVLVFETGYPDEGHEWCERLPNMLPTPQAWVESMLHEAGFARVAMIPAPGHQGTAGRLRARLGKQFHGVSSDRTLAKRIMNRVFRLDPRDGRDIFVACRL